MNLHHALRALDAARDQLPDGEHLLVEYLAHLPAHLWDEDCEITAGFIADLHRPLLDAEGAALAHPRHDLGVLAPAAERVRRTAQTWREARDFAQQCVACLDTEGGTQVIVVRLAHYVERLVEELRMIPGYQPYRTFKQFTHASLFPLSAAVDVVHFCLRHQIAPDPGLLAAAGPVGAPLDDPAPWRGPDITLVQDGTMLRVAFDHHWRAVQQIRAIPGRRYDRVSGGAWIVPVEQIGAVTAFAQRWALRFDKGVHEAASRQPAAL